MKNAIFISLILLLAQVLNASTSDLKEGNEIKKTIILINGAPFLVDIDDTGKVVYNYLLVENYFKSEETHENLIEKAEEEYNEELSMLSNSRLIIFDEQSSLLDDMAVDNIRELANKYNSGILQNINITAGYQPNERDEIEAEDRISAISQLLLDFGVKEGDISADLKIYRSELPNQFVKIDLLR